MCVCVCVVCVGELSTHKRELVVAVDIDRVEGLSQFHHQAYAALPVPRQHLLQRAG
eukprot:COSAG03_NODE_15206_length_438_cov_0.693215_2_plen_55_part_01